MVRDSVRAKRAEKIAKNLRVWQKTSKKKRCSLEKLALKIGATRKELAWRLKKGVQKSLKNARCVLKVIEAAPKIRFAKTLHREKGKLLSLRTVQRIKAPIRAKQKADESKRIRDLLALWGDSPVSTSQQGPWR